jgi:hypothetical protein
MVAAEVALYQISIEKDFERPQLSRRKYDIDNGFYETVIAISNESGVEIGY